MQKKNNIKSITAIMPYKNVKNNFAKSTHFFSFGPDILHKHLLTIEHFKQMLC